MGLLVQRIAAYRTLIAKQLKNLYVRWYKVMKRQVDGFQSWKPYVIMK